MRRPHILQRNERVESPSNCIFFDTETKSDLQPDGTQKLTLEFGMACYTRKIRHGAWSKGEWFTFTRSADFWLWVVEKLRKKSKMYIFAHNLVFDMTIVQGFTGLPLLDFQLVKAIVDDPPTILSYRYGKFSICLLDTFNWFHTSLAEIGQSIGMEKLEMPSQDAAQSAWDVYCHRDVEIIKTAMLTYLDFIKTNDLGNFQMTLASQAFTAYRHRFMHHSILIDSNEKALNLARQAYVGGRTEAFFIGEKTGKFYLMDVNSMYPFVMSTSKFPTVLRCVVARMRPDELAVTLKNNLVVADVTISVDEPCVPLRSTLGLLFPTGEFRTQLTTPELKYVLDNHHIVTVHRLSIYEYAPLFEQYVQTLFRLRQGYKADGNRAFSYLCKLMLNSFYGKFGQRGRVYQDIEQVDSQEVRNWTEYDADSRVIIKHRMFGGLHQIWQNEGESFNSHPAISAHVTAYARMWLWNLIRQAGAGHCYYCDTDSIVVDQAGYDRIAPYYLGDDLGELKLEHTFTHLVIHGAKDYEFDDIKKIKGIRKNATQLTANSFRQDRFSKFKSMVRAGNLDTMTITPQIKVLKREYQKGAVLSNGVVAPLELPADVNFLLPKSMQTGIAWGGTTNSDNRLYYAAKREDMRANLERGKSLREISR